MPIRVALETTFTLIVTRAWLLAESQLTNAATDTVDITGATTRLNTQARVYITDLLPVAGAFLARR